MNTRKARSRKDTDPCPGRLLFLLGRCAACGGLRRKRWGHTYRRRHHLFGLFGLFDLAITAHRALRQYVSPDLTVAKATAMSPSVSASGDPVAIFIFRAPCPCVPDEAGQLNGDEYSVCCRRDVSCSRRTQLDSPIFCIPEYFLLSHPANTTDVMNRVVLWTAALHAAP